MVLYKSVAPKKNKRSWGLHQMPAQDPPCKRPRLTPHEPDHILRARAGARQPSKPVEFQDLLVTDFASGKASATRVSRMFYSSFVLRTAPQKKKKFHVCT